MWTIPDLIVYAKGRAQPHAQLAGKHRTRKDAMLDAVVTVIQRGVSGAVWTAAQPPTTGNCFKVTLGPATVEIVATSESKGDAVEITFTTVPPPPAAGLDASTPFSRPLTIHEAIDEDALVETFLVLVRLGIDALYA